MRKRFTKIAAALAALVALALGGAALSSGGQASQAPAKPALAAEQGSEKAGAPVADTDSIQDENAADDATEPAGVEDASEPAESGSEVSGDDGPGGHADEPAVPNADHEVEGQE